MRIGILGPLEMRDEGGQPVRLGGARLRALVIRLALDPGRTVAAERLAGDLWPEDRMGWCEAHVDPHWEPDELARAAHFYHDYLQERLSPEERRRARLRWLLHNIEARLDLARFIESGALRAKVALAKCLGKAKRLSGFTRRSRPSRGLPRRPYTSVVDA